MSGIVAAIGILATQAAVFCQVLIVDRGLPAGIQPLGQTVLRIGWGADDQAFVGDDFRLGLAGENWIIDRMRTWAVVRGPDHTRNLNDVYTDVALYGGLAGDPIPDQARAAECDCHGLVVLKTARLAPGDSRVGNNDISFSPVTYSNGDQYRENGNVFSLWQVDFQNLRWSIPGGVAVQFAVRANGRVGTDVRGTDPWFNHGSAIKDAHRLRLFDKRGLLKSYFDAGGQIRDRAIGINVQAWGHRLVKIAVRRVEDSLEVRLHGEAGIDGSQIDLRSLRFGPNGANASGTSRQEDERTGYRDVVATFRARESGISPNTVSGCLRGRNRDAISFEGCDLVNATPLPCRKTPRP